MDSTGVVAIAGSVVVVVITWGLTEYSKRRAEHLARQSKIYDELVEAIEPIFADGPLRDSSDLSLLMNTLFARLALYAPDDVYLALKRELVGRPVYGVDAKPVIYGALRKSLFRRRTSLKASDLVDHLGAEHLPSRTGTPGPS